MKVINFVRRLVLLILQCLIGVEVLIWITVFPVLVKHLSFHFPEYIKAVLELHVKVFTFGEFLTADGRNSLFPVIFERYFDSMQILVLGLLAAFLIAFVITYLVFFMFKHKIKTLKNLLEIGEAIPDIMLILVIQLSVILIFRETGIKIAQVVSVRDKAILLPVICLSVPISFYITKVLLHYLEEELAKHYVALAKAKGLSFFYIVNIHVLRNIAEGMFGSSRTILWSMLSSLLVIDYLFNMNGLLRIMLTSSDPFIIGCFLIYFPLFILYRIYDWVSFESREGDRTI